MIRAPHSSPAVAASAASIWLPRVILLLLGLHFGRGVLPFTPVEGDELGVVNGLQAWARGTGDFADAAYSYPIQPGSYHLLHFLNQLTGAPELAVFCATTALAVVAFIFLSSILVSRVTGLRAAWVAVALLLMQEITTAAFYANTNAIAAVALMAGLVVAQRAESRAARWTAGLLIGLGGWLRLDSLLLSPVVLVLRLGHVPSGRALRETAEIALVSCAALLAACAACGLSLEMSWREFMGRDNFSQWQPLRVNGWFALGFVASATSMIGTVWLCLTRRWNQLGLAVTASGLPLVVYGGSFVSPKYFYYGAPLMLLPALSLLAGLLGAAGRPRRWLAFGLLAAFAGEALFGVQTASQFRRFDPSPPRIALGPVAVAGKSLTLGLGEGEIMQTADGPRLRGGQFWAPLVWHREKVAMREETARLAGILRDDPPALVLTSTYLSFGVVDGWLRQHGYQVGPRQPFQANRSSFTTNCQGTRHRLTLVLVNKTPHDTEEFNTWTISAQRIVFVNDRGGLEFRHLASTTGGWLPLSPSGNRLLTLYEHPPQ